MPTRLVPMSVSLLTPLSAQAADMPKQGTDSYTTVYVTTSSNTMKIGNRTITSYDTSGVSQNDNGGAMFNNIALSSVLGFWFGKSVTPSRREQDGAG